jgi:putative ABC transport system permease protein
MRFFEIIKLGVKNLFLHKLRSFLTVLGIIFGCGAVIAMVAIGEGARRKALEEIRLLGLQNITIRSVKPAQQEQQSSSQTTLFTSYGLKDEEVAHLGKVIPAIESIVPLRDLRKDVWSGSIRIDARVFGTLPAYEEVTNFRVAEGRFITSMDVKSYKQVCALGAEVKRQIFSHKNAVGKDVKIGDQWFTVVGVMEDKTLPGAEASAISIRDINKDVYVPLSTANKRLGVLSVRSTGGSREMTNIEVDEVYAKIKTPSLVVDAAASITNVLERSHPDKDYEIIVPLELLRQAERTTRIFKIVMGAIAGISLLVGGIGIMNIMLASVTERTREIGIRRAMGAKKRDIIQQFLIETVVLSGMGGVVGILLGMGLARSITFFAKWKTVVSPWALILAFGISAMVGIVFGMYPANKAAKMDPIRALRYE